ncbi:hypothetical protein [Rahnella laticis]|uniref:hypothetical protein n=1 Tax=Rahnella laticis TaxID=2787622 RepID=UPI0018A3069C|nr:hypothetical protein [Rahnella laticis]MBF7995934.1 hypothetical protein [Rahnella laticis]
MIETLNKLRRDLNSILSEPTSQVEMNITSDIVENYEGYVNGFKRAVELLDRTICENDPLAIQCALTRVRIASLNLSNLYQDIIDDVVLINKQDSWPAIPDDYKMPEIYNYPSEK